MSTTLITSNDPKGLQFVNLCASAYNKAQLDEERAQRLNERGGELQDAILETINRLAWASVSQERAREIMGRSFLGAAEVEKYFGVAFLSKQLRALARIPFSEATLEECKETHLLVAGAPLSILDVRAKAPKGTFYSNDDAWYDTEAFARDEKVAVRWYLIRKDIVADSTSKSFNEQQRLLGPKDEIPRACEVVYAVVLYYYLAMGERLFERMYVRCADVDSVGFRVGVGNFDSCGLSVGRYWGDNRRGCVGVASGRKFD